MPARSTRVYVVHQNALEVGLAFAMPSWWDVERLFEAHVHRRIALPDGREVLLLDWTAILGFDLKAGRKTWKMLGSTMAPPTIPEQQATLLEAFQEAEWFVVERERVWMVPERIRPGCDVGPEPVWWASAFWDPAFKTWYQTFRETHRLDARRFEMPNPLWLDYVSLLTGPEARMLDERAREGYTAWKKHLGERLTTHHRREMARFARSLQQAVWVVLYDYEWESGLA